MRIQTYTNVWSTKKQIYSIWDWSLPKPISLVAVGIFVGVLVMWAPLLAVFGVPFASPMGLMAYLSVPAVASFVGDKPMFEGKSLLEYVGSFFRYFGQPKIWTALRKDKEPRGKNIHITSTVWEPLHDDM